MEIVRRFQARPRKPSSPPEISGYPCLHRLYAPNPQRLLNSTRYYELMTIDERLEALAQSVELLASMQRETERVQQETQRFVAQRFGELAESMKQLANIAAAHDQLLDEHQQRLDKGGL